MFPLVASFIEEEAVNQVNIQSRAYYKNTHSEQIDYKMYSWKTPLPGRMLALLWHVVVVCTVSKTSYPTWVHHPLLTYNHTAYSTLCTETTFRCKELLCSGNQFIYSLFRINLFLWCWCFLQEIFTGGWEVMQRAERFLRVVRSSPGRQWTSTICPPCLTNRLENITTTSWIKTALTQTPADLWPLWTTLNLRMWCWDIDRFMTWLIQS